MNFPGSARVSRAGDRVLAIADFAEKDCFGETPKPTRGTRALPGANFVGKLPALPNHD
jgi:hypothetical protein